MLIGDGMKRKIISLILCLFIIFGCFLSTGCQYLAPDADDGDNSDPDGDVDGGDNENPDDGDKVDKPTPDGIDDPSRFGEVELTNNELRIALAEALAVVDYAIVDFDGLFPKNNSKNNIYDTMENDRGWWQGFWSGVLWHSYELSGYSKYKDEALSQIDSFYDRIVNQLGVNHHDMGFLYTPSCVAAYKLTGNAKAKEAALLAADHLVTRYNEDAKFIQAWGNVGEEDEFRLIVDCLLNIPLLYWAAEVDPDRAAYRDIAYNHFRTTLGVAYREDGSTYHTYFFDVKTGEPLYGATAQGAGDESTWARGQTWGMYGPLLTYAYEKDPLALDAFKTAANYYLNHLPEDYVAYWDLSYTDGDGEPRDSSSAAIAVCALLEGVKHLDEDDPYREIYYNAARRIMRSLIDSYTSRDIEGANGLLLHGTNSKPSGAGIDEMNTWGDYFYIEALHRMLDPDWELYW